VRVSVAIAWPQRQEVLELELPQGSTVADAVARAEALLPGVALAGMATGIWSHACGGETRLREGDRVELYRPLVADAKQMRRARVRGRK
jgi:putative ubiquitin-RnfH superfamily antitoxin RatB of RatAB toxin-antitoxin module